MECSALGPRRGGVDFLVRMRPGAVRRVRGYVGFNRARRARPDETLGVAD